MEETALPAEAFGEAEYSMEMPLPCPHCHQQISTVMIVRLLRVRVNFISTLPRHGHLVACPSCRGILAAGLGGM